MSTGRGPRRRAARATLAAAALAICTPAAAQASATLTQPANGATITLSAGYPSFAWTLPAGEVDPSAWVAPAAEVPDPSSVDPASAEQFADICDTPPDASDDWQRSSSCVSDQLLAAGSYYVYVRTLVPVPDDSGAYADDNGSYDAGFSALSAFTVPLVLAWGDGPDADPTDPLPAVQENYGANAENKPTAWVFVNGWLNEPGGQIAFTLTVKRGARVIKRIHPVRTIDPDSLYGAGVQVKLVLHQVHGIRPETRLSCAIVMTAGGVTLARTTTVKAV